MIQFILNNTTINTNLEPTTLLLDFIRYHKNLTGTKIGCREGDCGACTVLVGNIENNEVEYKSMTSCLTAIGNVNNKHIVTIEGINLENELNKIQDAMHQNSATQCGFCTPGFVVSMAGYCLSNKEFNAENAIASIDGNICRCTGYKPIERAAISLNELLKNKPINNSIEYLVEQKIIPTYFTTIQKRLENLNNNIDNNNNENGATFLAGGTDLYVQKHDEMLDTTACFVVNDTSLQYIKNENGVCKIGATTTVTQMLESEILQQHFKNLNTHLKLVSSTPIRNIATIAGNLVNASPIGDITIFLLALKASIILFDGKNERKILLNNFYLGYKKLDKQPNEKLISIEFELPKPNSFFNFEKVSKRKYLDIASVNTAIYFEQENNKITKAIISAGGVNATPFQLNKASDFLIDKNIDAATIKACIEIALTEIAPISDARGTKEYKTFLLSQLIKAHFSSVLQLQELEELVLN